MRYDDGFVAYLNGVKVASANAPAKPQWDSQATPATPIQRPSSSKPCTDQAFETFEKGQKCIGDSRLKRHENQFDFLIQPELGEDLAAVRPS